VQATCQTAACRLNALDYWITVTYKSADQTSADSENSGLTRSRAFSFFSVALDRVRLYYVYLHLMPELPKNLLVPELGPCVCSQVRRFARKLSSFYDVILTSKELTITQYSLLANIARSGQLQHTALAEKVGMERTTLTRNLHPLIRAGWLKIVPGLDRRQKWLQLTGAGKRKLVRSFPLWQEAQRKFISQFGLKQTDQLRGLIGRAQSIVSNDFRKPRKTRSPATSPESGRSSRKTARDS
jgi:DNA-binding MarR family transcriptional regulator